jgi:hypothetical protein
MSANIGTLSAVNYLVPSSGRTHAVPVEGVFGATAYQIDWGQFANANYPFMPQGVFIDNSQGVGELDVNIYANGLNGPIFWTIRCPAGSVKTANFPAPNGQQVAITGNGQATVIFVDFPVLPDAGAVTIENTVDVNVTNASVPVTVPVNAAGAPYQNTEVPALLTDLKYSGAITGGTTTTGNITPTANTYLRKLILTMSDNVTLAAAGLNVVTATLNGVQVFKESVYIPAAAAVNSRGAYWSQNLDFSKLGVPVGAAGSLVVTVGTALATGILEVNAYFG